MHRSSLRFDIASGLICLLCSFRVEPLHARADHQYDLGGQQRAELQAPPGRAGILNAENVFRRPIHSCVKARVVGEHRIDVVHELRGAFE
jgi:hypothetical protein